MVIKYTEGWWVLHEKIYLLENEPWYVETKQSLREVMTKLENLGARLVAIPKEEESGGFAAKLVALGHADPGIILRGMGSNFAWDRMFVEGEIRRLTYWRDKYENQSAPQRIQIEALYKQICDAL